MPEFHKLQNYKILEGFFFCLKNNCWWTVQVFAFGFCLFLKDSHRFGKNIQKAMVDIMGLFNLSKNCTKWAAFLVPGNLLLVGWELFCTVNKSKVCQRVAGEETESTPSWSPIKTLAVYLMCLFCCGLLVWVFFVSSMEELISTKDYF